MRDERETRILDEACELFIRYGYDKTTVGEIARAAGVSKGAIYLHFSSKEELFESLLIREMIRHSRNWLKCVEDDPRGGTIGGLYKATLKSLQSRPLIRAMFQRNQDMLGSFLHSKTSLFAGPSIQTIRAEFVAEMQAAGVMVDDVAPEVVAYILDAVGYGIVGLGEIRDASRQPDLGAIVDFIGELLEARLTPGDADPAKGVAIVREAIAKGEERLAEYLKAKKRASSTSSLKK